MNRAKVKALHEAVSEACKQIASEYGLSYVEGRGSYTNANVTFKVGFAEVGEDGTARTREAEDYERVQEMYKLPPLGSTFRHVGEEYRIVGWKARSTKYPILAERVRDGQQYKFAKVTVTLAATGGRVKDPE